MREAASNLSIHSVEPLILTHNIKSFHQIIPVRTGTSNLMIFLSTTQFPKHFYPKLLIIIIDIITFNFKVKVWENWKINLYNL